MYSLYPSSCFLSVSNLYTPSNLNISASLCTSIILSMRSSNIKHYKVINLMIAVCSISFLMICCPIFHFDRQMKHSKKTPSSKILVLLVLRMYANLMHIHKWYKSNIKSCSLRYICHILQEHYQNNLVHFN